MKRDQWLATCEAVESASVDLARTLGFGHDVILSPADFARFLVWAEGEPEWKRPARRVRRLCALRDRLWKARWPEPFPQPETSDERKA